MPGKQAQERRIEFGERVFFSTPKKGRAKMDLRWRLGIYLGHAPNSNELFVGVVNGNVIKARSAVRVVEKTRWDRVAVEKIQGTPGDMLPVDDDTFTADDVEGAEAAHEFDADDLPGPQGEPSSWR